MPGEYSEELVELVARGIVDEIKKYPRLPAHEFGGAVGWGANERDLARAVLDALSSAGRLVPEGSEVREEWQLRFDYTDGSDGRLTTASEDEARSWERAHGDCHHGTQLVGRRVITTPWTPAEPAQEARTSAGCDDCDGTCDERCSCPGCTAPAQEER